jgi:hypothetical protein
MLHAEILLMDAVLELAVTDIPKIGLNEAALCIRRSFAVQRTPLSDEFDLSVRTEDLLQIVTSEILRVLSGGYSTLDTLA